MAIAFMCSACFAGGVANHSGMLRGAVAGAFIFGMAILGFCIIAFVRYLIAQFRNSTIDEGIPRA